MKNYVCFVNDHSGSMASLARYAVTDYNTNIEAVKNAASTEMLDTVVSVVGVGLNGGTTPGVLRQVQISNPHVLKPITNWPCPGGTPLYDGIGNMIELMQSLPDIDKEEVSVLLMITTDGEEAHSQTKYRDPEVLGALIKEVTNTDRWTIVARVPTGLSSRGRAQLKAIGIQPGNMQYWETTAAGIAASTVATQAAVGSFYRARSAGVKSTGSFYADATKVNLAVLEDISKKVSLYIVPQADNGVEIRPFVLRHRMEYLKGSAFYQLSKTESKVAHDKIILIREKTTGKVFAGKEARDMIGLPSDRNARLHPGNHANYDIFIQSFSVNRKLVAGSGVLYWAEIGVPFTEADLAYLQPKTPAAAPAVPQLLTVPVTNTPTKSPIPVTPRFEFFETREDARRFCGEHGIVQSEILSNPTGIKGKRWSVPTALAKQATTA